MRSSWGGSALRKEGSGGPSHSVQLPDGRVEPGGFGICCQGTSGNGLRLHWGMFRLDIRKTFLHRKGCPFTRARRP